LQAISTETIRKFSNQPAWHYASGLILLLIEAKLLLFSSQIWQV